MEERFYFAYGSNMDLSQMDFRCPAAKVAETVRLEGFRLAFCGRDPAGGVATILKEEGSYVDGVLWKITRECEESLDFYEGYPRFYGKETIRVRNQEGMETESMAYVMNPPMRDCPAVPAKIYLDGIIKGCRQNGIPEEPVEEAVKRSRREIRNQKRKKDKDALIR